MPVMSVVGSAWCHWEKLKNCTVNIDHQKKKRKTKTQKKKKNKKKKKKKNK